MEYYTRHKKEFNNGMCSNMDGLRDYHTKSVGKKKTIPYDITYMWDLKHDTNEPIY